MPAIRIASGELFDPWNPELLKSNISEGGVERWFWLGHHLANECRYAGGCKWYYSVAQHSVLASRCVDLRPVPDSIDDCKLLYTYERKLRLAALLHDATEAVLKDIPGPYKKTHTKFALGYYAVESDLMKWFYKQFGIEEYLNAPQIKAIDKELLDAERHVLFSGESGYSGSIRVEPWDREYARDEFKRTLLDLTR